VRILKGVPFFQFKGYKRGTLIFCQIGIQKGKGLDLGVEPPYRTL